MTTLNIAHMYTQARLAFFNIYHTLQPDLLKSSSGKSLETVEWKFVTD